MVATCSATLIHPVPLQGPQRGKHLALPSQMMESELGSLEGLVATGLNSVTCYWEQIICT